ncbi:hypothetical protein C7I87_03020 [Mesorhizobium sp. SARCC-RB16n]|nr:hypothetical protein C7I87_03020 [Mesorhizobium sp. SARCC-RB16n]
MWAKPDFEASADFLPRPWSPGADRAWIVGWLPWDELIAGLLAYVPALGAAREPPSAEGYAKYWGEITCLEVEARTGNPDGTMASKTAFP